MNDTADVEDVDTDAGLLASCRAAVRKKGKNSAMAHAAFGKFEAKWRPVVLRWATAKLEGNEFDAEDLTEAAFEKAWDWISHSSGLPPNASILLNTCLDRAFTDRLRKLHGRRKVEDRVQQAERAQAIGERPEPRKRPGTNPRFPLSLESADEDLQPLIEQIGDADVEFEVVAKEAIKEGFASLPPHYRNCIICRSIWGLSVPETQARLGLSYDQVTRYTAAGVARFMAFLTEAMTD